MKVTKFLPIVMLALGLSACNKTPGELVGVSAQGGPRSEGVPEGMVFVRKGSFDMGLTSTSVLNNQPDNIVKVAVDAFWMDATEITNSEYRQFVNWVRDSIAYEMLIDGNPTSKFAVDLTAYAAATGASRDYKIKWSEPIPWNERLDVNNVGTYEWEKLFDDGGFGKMRTGKLHYSYYYENKDATKAVRNSMNRVTGRYGKDAIKVDEYIANEEFVDCNTIDRVINNEKDFLTNVIIRIYPDTTVWGRYFEHSYNAPQVESYFSNVNYSNYPVVGVTWEQARAFCHWRTELLRNVGEQVIHEYRLPTEAEWEYAARGGRKRAMYPWGDMYARDSRGCYQANWNPLNGDKVNDEHLITAPVEWYKPNDFGLYDMAGNVAEWTSSTYSTTSNLRVHNSNPNYSYDALFSDPIDKKKKVIKGGSWKDISYYLQCGARTYEYQMEAQPYIGFRCVRSVMGNQK